MTSRDKLPTTTTVGQVVPPANRSGSLVTRGLAAIKTLQQVRGQFGLTPEEHLAPATKIRDDRLVDLAEAYERMLRWFRTLGVGDLPRIPDRLSTVELSRLRLRHALEVARTDFSMAARIIRKHHRGEVNLAKEYEDKAAQLQREEIRALHDAAEQGDAEAQLELGLAYQDGWGVPQDDVQAAKWWLRAAEQGKWRRDAFYGLGDAQYVLGEAYHEGRGVPQDDALAVKWWLRAVQQGHWGAEAELVELGRGQGGPFQLTLEEHRAAAMKIREHRPEREDLAQAHDQMIAAIRHLVQRF